jgi:hypothetical protein
MSNYPIIIAVLATTLSAYALYLTFGSDKNSETNKVNEDEYEMSKINPSDPNLYNSSSGQEAAIGGFKTKRHKNKHMKKKSKNRRRSKKSKK